MKTTYILFLFLFVINAGFSQTGISTTVIHPKAELHIVSPGNNTGVLIPRMTTAQINAIASPAIGLLTYSTDNNTFFFYNGTAWVRIGNDCTIIQDNDNDTDISVDNGADNDEATFTAGGTQVMVINKDGIIQNIGDLIKTNGNININNEYSLPLVDGNNNEVMITDGSGNLTWQDPKTLPGLIAGVVTFPLVCGREMNALGDKVWYTVLIPWCDMTVNKISFYANVAGSPVIKIGIYDDTNTLLTQGSVTLATAGLQFATVNMPAAFKLNAGKLYRIGSVDVNRSTTTLLENPNYQSGLHWSTTSVVPQSLPATIVGYNN